MLTVCWIVTLDVLKFAVGCLCRYACVLNSNIRCIEIVKHKMAVEHFLRWIVTLDVLKWTTATLTGKY